MHIEALIVIIATYFFRGYHKHKLITKKNGILDAIKTYIAHN